MNNSITNPLQVVNLENVYLKLKSQDSENKMKKLANSKYIEAKDGGELIVKKKNLRQLTDKIISVFKATNNKKKDTNKATLTIEKKKSSIIVVRTKTVTTIIEKDKNNNNLLLVTRSISTLGLNKKDETVPLVENEENCDICNPSEGSKAKKLNISERLDCLNEEYKNQQLNLYHHINQNKKKIKVNIEKKTRRKIDEFELEEIVDSIMKVETWMKSFQKN